MNEQIDAFPIGELTVVQEQESEKQRIKRNHMSFRDQCVVDAFLKANLVSQGGGFWAYAPGWTDQKVADAASQELGHPITFGNVAGFRHVNYGKLAKVIVKEDNSDLLERMYDMHARLEKLELWVSQYDTLCKQQQHQINELMLKLGSKSIR